MDWIGVARVEGARDMCTRTGDVSRVSCVERCEGGGFGRLFEDNQPINQPTNQLTNQPVNQPTGRCFSRAMSFPHRRSMGEVVHAPCDWSRGTSLLLCAIEGSKSSRDESDTMVRCCWGTNGEASGESFRGCVVGGEVV